MFKTGLFGKSTVFQCLRLSYAMVILYGWNNSNIFLTLNVPCRNKGTSLKILPLNVDILYWKLGFGNVSWLRACHTAQNLTILQIIQTLYHLILSINCFVITVSCIPIYHTLPSVWVFMLWRGMNRLLIKSWWVSIYLIHFWFAS